MSWLEKLLPTKIRTQGRQKKGVPEGLWSKCTVCEAVLYRAELEKSMEVCPKCGHHMRISARQRIKLFLDKDTEQELAADLSPTDFLRFKDTKKYKERLASAQKNTGENDALLVFKGRANNLPIVVAAFEFSFMGGSMGAVVGERFVRGVRQAIDDECAFVCFSTSGGARMQEALISLMQMAKTSNALAKLHQKGLPFISVLLDPTMGGVSASLAMLGDVIIAEPKALIGFAGPRVIQQTVHETLPEGFQRSEFLQAHGAIDMIVDRRDMKNTITRLISKFMSRC